MIQHLHVDVEYRLVLVPNVCLEIAEIQWGYPNSIGVDCQVNDAGLDMHDEGEHQNGNDASQLSLCLLRRMHVGNSRIDLPEPH